MKIAFERETYLWTRRGTREGVRMDGTGKGIHNALTRWGIVPGLWHGEKGDGGRTMGRYSRRKAMHPNPLLSPSSSSPPSKKKGSSNNHSTILLLSHARHHIKTTPSALQEKFCVQELRSASSCYVRLFGKRKMAKLIWIRCKFWADLSSFSCGKKPKKKKPASQGFY